MAKTIKDLVKLALPLGREKRSALALAQKYLTPEDLATLSYFLKIDRCFATLERWHTTPDLFADAEWPVFKTHLKEQGLGEFLGRINTIITERATHEAFAQFAPHALARISERIAPNIVGFMPEKQAVCTILFSKDPLHLLLIGDPGTGKTDMLRSLERMSPISSFGLGSGVSGVGLSAAVRGEEIVKGLLPLADGGIACIDELNLIKPKDLASLYNAMEKGFVAYDKGVTHETLPARVRVCATANPTTSTFIGQTPDVLRKQIPFTDALLSRFHYLFIIRKPTAEEFEEIARRIVKGTPYDLSAHDLAFIKAYVQHALSVEVTIQNELELDLVALVKRLKQDERKFLVEVGPRTVVGLVRLVKAIARAELSPAVKRKHIAQATELLEHALYRGRR